MLEMATLLLVKPITVLLFGPRSEGTQAKSCGKRKAKHIGCGSQGHREGANKCRKRATHIETLHAHNLFPHCYVAGDHHHGLVWLGLCFQVHAGKPRGSRVCQVLRCIGPTITIFPITPRIKSASQEWTRSTGTSVTRQRALAAYSAHGPPVLAILGTCRLTLHSCTSLIIPGDRARILSYVFYVLGSLRFGSHAMRPFRRRDARHHLRPRTVAGLATLFQRDALLLRSDVGIRARGASAPLWASQQSQFYRSIAGRTAGSRRARGSFTCDRG
ncbi:hypothetical protein CALCODRAFT_109459 [Calocera cornea HHB12733]|uniref:Secreted protein n=1 Tax=Calocera cornea HHB12733 TaxID=1353952 RepID=A0A165D2X4_9BASI|nr:hypothetical protein CALCODRAFT_109459 [Calocera cornea HHB12733]